MGIKDTCGKFGEKAGKVASKAANAAVDKGKTAANAAKKGAGKAAEIGVAAADSAAKNVKLAAKKARDARIERKREKLHPVMREEYLTPGYDTPGIIHVVDEDQRKHEELCDGAIGWLTVLPDGTEVLSMYSNFVEESGLAFYPQSVKGSVYCTDLFDDKRYIDVTSFFETAQSEQATELKQIAHKLGARECRLEMVDREKSSSKKKLDMSASGSKGSRRKGAGPSGESSHESSQDGLKVSEVVFDQRFDGGEPVKPTLKWFANNAEMLDLITTRLDPNANSTTEYTLGLKSLAVTNFSESMAATVDAAFAKLKVKTSFKMTQETQREKEKILKFYIKF